MNPLAPVMKRDLLMSLLAGFFRLTGHHLSRQLGHIPAAARQSLRRPRPQTRRRRVNGPS